jgi:hypothetical protein
LVRIKSKALIKVIIAVIIKIIGKLKAKPIIKQDPELLFHKTIMMNQKKDDIKVKNHS